MVTGVYADAAHSQPLVKFVYDEKGYRAVKQSYQLQARTYYVRDVAGNVLSIYTEDVSAGKAARQTEVPLYGAGRLGVFVIPEIAVGRGGDSRRAQ